MKSRFAFGMFAGFALACLFFFFFLYFYPSAFRAQAAKNSPQYDAIGYYKVYDVSPVTEYAEPYLASAKYYGGAPVAEYQAAVYQYAPDHIPAPAITTEVPAYELQRVAPVRYSPPATPDAPSSDPYYLQAI